MFAMAGHGLWLSILGTLRPSATAAILLSSLSLSSLSDDIPDHELAVIDEIHAKVWGESAWDRPQAQPADAHKVFGSALEQVQTPEGRALVWELRADYFRAIGDHAESMRASRVIYKDFRIV